ncbi:MAG TPA: M23 family metallopeptidase [Patescibacteria group bacterium]|nr:M23 family metallopeptidase [Patescibacteria group bacterium]
MKKALVGIAAAFVAVVLLLASVLAAVKDGALSCASGVISSAVSPLIKAPEQLANWILIDKIGQKLGATEKERAVAVSVSYQETGSKNLRFGDQDSLGLFQQRPSQGWGTPAQLMDPVYATTQFYKAMFKVKGRESMNPLQLALAVQRPSYAAYTQPGHAFTSWIGDAANFIKQAASGVLPKLGDQPKDVPSRQQAQEANSASSVCALIADGVLGGLPDLVPGFNSSSGTGKLGMPLEKMNPTSEYGMRFHPIYHVWRLHDGLDLGAPTGTPIYAAADGVVVTVSSQPTGFGNYIQINHGGGLQTGYAHQSRFADGIRVGVTVKRGQLIGYVGSTGSSTAHHLHFRVLKDGTAVNPRPYLGLTAKR